MAALALRLREPLRTPASELVASLCTLSKAYSYTLSEQAGLERREAAMAGKENPGEALEAGRLADAAAQFLTR